MTGICKRCGGVTEPPLDPKLAALGPGKYCRACATLRFIEQQEREALPHSLRSIIRDRGILEQAVGGELDYAFWHELIASAMCAALHSPEWALAVLDIETVNETVAEMIAVRGACFTADHPVREASHDDAD